MQRQVLFATLNRANVGPMQTRGVGETLLGVASGVTMLADHVAKASPQE
jgi:hypothetical protein